MVRIVLVIASLLLVPVVPPAVGETDHGCLPADLSSFEEVRPRGTLDGHPGWTRAVGYTIDRLPMTPTLLAIRGTQACDLTRGLAEFLGPQASPASATEALGTALLAIGAVHVDVLPDPVLRGEPTVSRVDGGWLVGAEVWTPRNGVVADARVRLDGDVDVRFRVTERAVGGFKGEPDGWNLLPGMTDATVRGDDLSALTTKVIFGTNADGSQWRVTYFTERYGSEAEADHHANMHLQAALRSYANETSWGLVSRDPDRILDLTLDGCDCIFSGFQANIHMFPRANDILPLIPGLAYRNEPELAELIVGHELFHHFQYSYMQWRMGNWLTEGMARFSETIHVPDATFLPTTLLYFPNDNGMNGFLLNPARSIGQHTYDWAIVWGWLYAHEGGVALLKAVLEETATGGTNPNVDGPAAIQRAMDRVPGGEHATFEQSYRAFADAILTKEGWVWGAPDGSQVHDWSTYFLPVARQRFVAGPFILPQWGIQLHDAKPGAHGAAVLTFAGSPTLEARMMTVAGGERSFAPALPANAVAAVDDAALMVQRFLPAPPGDSANLAGAYAVGVAR